jgi:MYXO-CTERM domain-containing protein
MPFMNDQVCGYDRGGGFVDPEHNYGAIVFSDEQQAGCGTEGAQVTFKLVDAQGKVIAIANQTGVWHAWDGVSDPQQLNLTFGPVGGIKLGNTGTGDASGDEGSASGRLSTLLGFVGLTGAALGFALRRRTTTR